MLIFPILQNSCSTVNSELNLFGLSSTEPEVSAPIPLKHIISQKLKANVDVKAAIADGGASAEFVQSCGYDIEVQSRSIPDSKLESLQNRQGPWG